MKTSQVLSLAMLSVLLLPNTAKAETLTWHMQSSHPNTVHFQLYSRSRNLVWPGSGTVWVLDDYETKTNSISCSYGDKICYGAWTAGDSSTYWGVGKNDRYGCYDCCYTCDGGETRHIELTE